MSLATSYEGRAGALHPRRTSTPGQLQKRGISGGELESSKKGGGRGQASKRTLGRRAVLLVLGRLEGLLGLVQQVVLVVLVRGEHTLVVCGLDGPGVEEAVEEAGDEGGVPEDLLGWEGRGGRVAVRR